jgi:alpha-mannosidase
LFHFWFSGATIQERLSAIDREALEKNEKPFPLSFFPSGEGEKPLPGLFLTDQVIQVSSFKKAEDNDDLIIRLFEPTGERRSTTLSLPCASVEKKVSLEAFEIKTFRFDWKAKTFADVDLMENRFS